MKMQVATLDLKQASDWIIGPKPLILVNILHKGICVISLTQGYKM